MRIDRPRVQRYTRAALRWARLLALRGGHDGVRVFYGHDDVPRPDDRAAGGTVKMQKLASRWRNSPTDFNVLYLGSTWLPRDLRPLLWLARRRRAAVIVNQDGIAYPGWAGDETDELNRRNRRVLLAADHVLYQSEFSKRSADEFLGEPNGSWEILYNAVDVERFTPDSRPREREQPVLLLAGDQTQAYRLELALRTLAEVPEARLLVTGRLVSSPDALIRELRVADRVEFTGPYAQRDAPAIYRRADVLLHTKVQDPCPTAVIEAMASGLPVVYPASGGTVELVGDDAGVGIAHPVSWDRDEPPSPAQFADGVRRVLDALPTYAVSARSRAVERFALGPWLARHDELFKDAGLRGRTSRTH